MWRRKLVESRMNQWLFQDMFSFMIIVDQWQGHGSSILERMETGPLICRVNQWTDFCMIRTFVMHDLMVVITCLHISNKLSEIKRL